MKELKFDGERVVLNDTTPEYLIKEHLDRYLFAKKFVKNKTVLDIACGTGYGSFELAKSGAKKVIGGDISKEAIDYATQKYIKNNLSFKEMSAESIDIQDNSIDIVVSFETVEHLPNYKKFLIEVERVLKSGGLFICSSPNKIITSPFTKKPLNSFHIKEFKVKELMSLLKNNKFVDVEVFGQSFVKNNLRLWVKNFIRSYLRFAIKFYKNFLNLNKSFDSAKNVNEIRKIRKKDLEPTYFILVAKKK